MLYYLQNNAVAIDNIDKLQDKVMFTIHPDYWTYAWFSWGKQLVFQNVKNIVKRVKLLGTN